MTPSMTVVLVILTATVLLFITNKVRADVVGLLAVLALLLTRTLNVPDALSGFANPAVITIAAIFIVTAGLAHTGIAAHIGNLLFRVAGKSESRLVAATMAVAAVLSLIMNNIAAAAVLIPGLKNLSQRTAVSSSRLMIPLSFGTLLGGMATLFTTINLLANDALRQAGMEPFSLWDFFRIGSIECAAGIIYMATAGRKLLHVYPDRETLRTYRNPDELTKLYRLPDLMFEARINQGSSLSGRSIGESRIGSLYHCNILGLFRGRKLILAPQSGEILYAGDRMIIEGDRQSLLNVQKDQGLTLTGMGGDINIDLANQDIGIVEVMISPHAGIVGRSLQEMNFRYKYGLSALAIMRDGKPILQEIKNLPLRFGDTLLIHGPRPNFQRLSQEQDFIVLGAPEYPGEIVRTKKAVWALTGTAIMVLTAGLGWLPIVTASLLGALIIVLSGALKIEEGYQAIEWKAVVLVGSMLSLGTALTATGAADMISRNFLQLLHPLGPLGILAGFYLISMLLAQMVSGAATAVLMAPIAMSAAIHLHLSAYPLVMMLVLGASSGFLTPVSHPVNIFVMGPGGYQFRDYARVGWGLTALVFLLSMILVPVFWPLLAK